MDKLLIAYNLTEDEVKKLKQYGFRVVVIENNMVDLKVKDIIAGVKEGNEKENMPTEKIILFNNYKNTELQGTIKKVRNYVTGGILAVVTPISINWTFDYLIEHLIEERETVMSQQKGR